jgi:TPR repeat protein
MDEIKFSLTQADKVAIERKDDDYINAKGAKLYGNQSYSQAVEYYRLGAVMGNSVSISNLGYCYLYGRDIPQNTALAIAYFKIASEKGNPDAAYKLGDIYSRDTWGLEDKELSIYYYSLAVTYIMGSDWQLLDDLYYADELQYFPSLCFALARELAKGEALIANIPLSYQFLLHAKIGYENELAQGFEMYRQSYESVQSLMVDPQYDEVRDKYDDIYFDDKENDEEDIDF